MVTASKPAFDICLVGHITKDRIIVAGQRERIAPGGTAYYSALTYAGLGLRVAVVTKLHDSDHPLILKAMENDNITLLAGDSAATTTFDNIYPNPDLQHRVQRVSAIADTLQPQDLDAITASIYHLGPLTATDMTPALLPAAAGHGQLTALDVQGLIRRIENGEVRQQDWPHKHTCFQSIDILKADTHEARFLTGMTDPADAARILAAYGPREVIITQDDRGSFVFCEDTIHVIPAYPPAHLRDPTGCGDTYLAAYVTRRWQGDSPPLAGRFAAMAATMNLATSGPFIGSQAEVQQELARMQAAQQGRQSLAAGQTKSPRTEIPSPVMGEGIGRKE